MIQFLLILWLAVTFVYFLLDSFLGIQKEEREPPFLRSRVPWIGHLLGFLQYKAKYYFRLGKANPVQKIFSLAIPRSRVYVATSPDLIAAIHRNTQSIQFTPYAAHFLVRMCGISTEGRAIWTKPESPHLWEGWAKEIQVSLAKGEELENIHQAAVQQLQSILDALLLGSRPAKIDLLQWVSHAMIMATCRTLWGPGNPMSDPRVEEAYFDFKRNLTLLVLEFMPSVLIPKSYQGRAICAKAFTKYFRNGCAKQSSKFVKTRYYMSREAGLSDEDIAGSELGMLYGSIANTTLVAFWMVFYVCSVPGLLAECRRELESIMHDKNLSPAFAAQHCPLLQSTMKETMRHQSTGTNRRFVMEETVLNDRYLLKKGGIVEIPAESVHFDEDIWGPSVQTFDPFRFYKNINGTAGERKIPAHAFRGFGGGHTMCPGRHLATKEITSLAAMLIDGFDIVPVQGEWKMPKTEAEDINAVMMNPTSDIAVLVEKRVK